MRYLTVAASLALAASSLLAPMAQAQTPGSPSMFHDCMLGVFNGDIDMADDAFRAVLLSGQTFDPTEDRWDGVMANEITGTGYASDGVAIDLTVANVAGTIVVDVATDPQWTSATISAEELYVVRDANGDGVLNNADVPCFRIDLNSTGGAVTSTAEDFGITIDVTGLMRVDVPDS